MNRPIFVFGSNDAGRHGKGAALYAKQKYGAKNGVGYGRTGDAYAIPTKDKSLNVKSLSDIEAAIYFFLEHAKSNPDDTFYLTPVGCGLAGYDRRQIWKILKEYGVPDNVFLTSTWVND